MKRSNTEILNKVKSAINERKQKLNKTPTIKFDNESNEIDKEISQWIDDNAAQIAKEIINEAVKKIFK